MARKKGEGGRGRQRAQQRDQYDELDKYPVMPPHAFARIVRDKPTLNIIYQIIEPPMTKKEQEQREEIMDIFIRSLTANIEEIDANPEAYLRTAMDKVIKAYGMKITKKSKSKLFYSADEPRSWPTNPSENTLYTRMVVDCCGPPAVIV